jgi:hypothetical protein
MKPNDVWYMLIIIYNFYYQFKLVSNLASSLSNEFESRNIIVNEKRPGETAGFINCILLIVTYLNSLTKFDTGAFKSILSLGLLISWIIYWIKIRNYRKLIIADNNKTSNIL